MSNKWATFNEALASAERTSPSGVATLSFGSGPRPGPFLSRSSVAGYCLLFYIRLLCTSAQIPAVLKQVWVYCWPARLAFLQGRLSRIHDSKGSFLYLLSCPYCSLQFFLAPSLFGHSCWLRLGTALLEQEDVGQTLAAVKASNVHTQTGRTPR